MRKLTALYHRWLERDGTSSKRIVLKSARTAFGAEAVAAALGHGAQPGAELLTTKNAHATWRKLKLESVRCFELVQLQAMWEEVLAGIGSTTGGEPEGGLPGSYGTASARLRLRRLHQVGASREVSRLEEVRLQ